MQINKSERRGDAIVLTISTDTVEYERPLVIQHTPGEDGYAVISGPDISDEENAEADKLVDTWLRQNDLPALLRD